MSVCTIGPRRHRHLLCDHTYTGTVRWPVQPPASPRELAASVYSCGRPECVADAAAWVAERTGHRGQFHPFTGSAA